MTKLFWFNWPSAVGGADTKFVHSLPLLAKRYEITVVPNNAEYLRQTSWREWIENCGARVGLLEELPSRCEGWAVSLCNGAFFLEGMAGAVKERGLKVAWSNEMMWHFPAERGALALGLIDTLMYTSPVQRAVLEPGYQRMLWGSQRPPRTARSEAAWGHLKTPQGHRIPWVVTGQYVDPSQFPFRQRGSDANRPFTIGRLSRADPAKFPDDFPASYEALDLRCPVRFRVMAWSEDLAQRWAAHQFDSRWEFLPVAAEPSARFLDSLDVFVYDLSPRFKESWGRAVVEAMLSGAVPLVPRGGGHHLERLVKHEVSGFLCDNREDYGHYARLLQNDRSLLRRLSCGARQWAENELCDRVGHLRLWQRVFQSA